MANLKLINMKNSNWSEDYISNMYMNFQTLTWRIYEINIHKHAFQHITKHERES